MGLGSNTVDWPMVVVSVSSGALKGGSEEREVDDEFALPSEKVENEPVDEVEQLRYDEADVGVEVPEGDWMREEMSRNSSNEVGESEKKPSREAKRSSDDPAPAEATSWYEAVAMSSKALVVGASHG